MSVVVQKYGGTSVENPSRIGAVADRVVGTRAHGRNVVVVVSAMGQTTDELLSLAAEVSSEPHPREMDMLLTAGERISMALLAMALHDRGVPAVSFTGSQAGILTDSAHGGARITRITGERVRDALAEERVVIVAGFQGVDPESREVTTLGRGGSDTTAVALAATLDAEACEILTDVEGVFTADPRMVPNASKIDSLGYTQMMALAAAGAGVLMPHSVEFARDMGVPVHVRSSFSSEVGTWVRSDEDDRPFVGVAVRAEDRRSVLTIVGSQASVLSTELVVAVQEAGIEATLIGADATRVELLVGDERVEDAVQLVHGRLFDMKVGK